MRLDHAQVSADNIWWFLLTSVRYSLGRMYYAASLTAGLVRSYCSWLMPEQRAQIAREIREDLNRRADYGGYLPEDIIETWQELASDLERAVNA